VSSSEYWHQKPLTDLGVTQATQGAGFTGLRFASVPIKIGTKLLQSLTQTHCLVISLKTTDPG